MKRKIMEERLNLLESQKVIGRKAAEAVRIAMNVLHSEGAVIDEERAVSFFTNIGTFVHFAGTIEGFYKKAQRKGERNGRALRERGT